MLYKRCCTNKIVQWFVGVVLLVLSHSLYAIYFQSPIDINNLFVRIGQEPQVNINARGGAMAIWLEDNPSASNVYARPYSASAWGLVNNLSSNTAENSYEPAIAINSNGLAVAVWIEDTSATIPGANVYARRYVSNAWVPAVGSTAEVLTNDPASLFTGGTPHIAIDESNNAIAVWQEINHATSRGNIYSRIYTSGSWVPALGSAATNLNSSSANSASDPQIVMNATGKAIAVWVENSKIYARYYNGSSWEAAALLTNNTASAPQVAINANGYARAVWVESNTIYQSYFNGSSWSVAALLAGATSSAPQIAINTNNHAMAVWVENNNVYAGYYDGSTWNTPPVNLNYISAQSGSAPHVAMDDGNNAVVVWVEQNNIFARYFNGTIWSPAIDINNNPAKAATTPQVTANAKGDALTIWSELNTTANNIYASAVLPINLNQFLVVNSAGNTLVAWQQTSDYYATNLSVQTTSPAVLAQGQVKNTTLPSGDSSGIFMDALGNAWTFVQNGNVLTKYTHAVGDPVNQWTTTVITDTAASWAADVNLSGDVVSGYVDEGGNVYGIYNGTTTLITTSASRVQAAISSGTTNVALTFQGDLGVTGSGSIAAAVYDPATLSWVLSPTLVASGASDPCVYVDNNYNVTLVWRYKYDGTHYQVQAARGIFVKQSTWDWSTPIVDLTGATDDADVDTLQIAGDGSGNAIATWEYTDNTTAYTAIQAAYYVFNDSWLAATTLSSTGSSASRAAISMDNAGNAIVVWLIPYYNGTTVITRVQGTYFNATTKQWQAIKQTAGPVITTYISPADKFANTVCTTLGANGIGLVTYTLSYSSTPPNTLYGNVVQPAKGLIRDAQNLNQPVGTYETISCAFNSTNLLGVASNDMNIFEDNTRITLSGNQAFSYGLVQWCSAFKGSKQYIAAVNDNNPVIDWYAFDPSTTPSLTYIQSLSLTNVTNVVRDMAVYNKSDTELYLAIATQSNVQIELWNGSSFVAKGVLDTTVSGTVNRISWWVDGFNANYVAYLATADMNNKINIYGLDASYSFNLIDSAVVGSMPITSLLWYVHSDAENQIDMLDLVGGSTRDSNVYVLNVDLETKNINNVVANVRDYPMSGLSTCDTYLAIGDYGVPTGTGAAIRLYDVSTSGSISQTDFVISDTHAAHVYYLAKCCMGSPQYLLAGIGDDTEYTLYAYEQDLSSLIAKQKIGSFVDSVAWSPTGTNTYLSVTYQDDIFNRAGRMYKLDVTQVPSLVDLGTISY